MSGYRRNVVFPLLLPPHSSSTYLPRQAQFYCISRCSPGNGCLSFLLVGFLVPMKDCLRSPLTWLRLSSDSCPSPGKGRGKAIVLYTGLMMDRSEDPLEFFQPSLIEAGLGAVDVSGGCPQNGEILGTYLPCLKSSATIQRPQEKNCSVPC